jgi:hypothetical protein
MNDLDSIGYVALRSVSGAVAKPAAHSGFRLGIRLVTLNAASFPTGDP